MTQPPAKFSTPPTLTFVAKVQAAMLRAAVTALVISLICVVLVLFVGMVGVWAGSAESFPSIGVVAPGAGLLATILFMILAPLFLLLSTRPMQDRAFTVCGFAATFFGLAMLVVFFTELGMNVLQWFHETPRLVERQNQMLIDKVGRAKQELATSIKAREDALAEIDADKTKTAEEKQADTAALRELLDPDISDQEKTLVEHERAVERDFRADTSPWGLLVYFMSHGTAQRNTPQDAGIWYALLGSVWVGLITLLFAVPVGVGAAVYLEEYRSDTWLSRLIQVNINNLAGVPSVVYGILGAFVFVGLIFRPLENRYPWISARNVLGGGLTLGLLTLPVVIVSAQEAIRAVPNSIRQGAIALGATRWQTTWRTVLPMSLPGILTGTILSLSRAIGEAAPLLLFGAIMFVAQEPSIYGRFTILPMQIFTWSSQPPTTMPDGSTIDAWKNNAAMGSVVLLIMLLAMNGVAIYLRNRAQKRTRY
jgi:phosphate transport system permease protein